MSFHMNLNITCKTPICRVLHRILYKFRIQKKISDIFMLVERLGTARFHPRYDMDFISTRSFFSGQHVRYLVIHQIYQRAQVEIHDHVIAITSKTRQKGKIGIVKARIQSLKSNIKTFTGSTLL